MLDLYPGHDVSPKALAYDVNVAFHELISAQIEKFQPTDLCICSEEDSILVDGLANEELLNSLAGKIRQNASIWDGELRVFTSTEPSFSEGSAHLNNLAMSKHEHEVAVEALKSGVINRTLEGNVIDIYGFKGRFFRRDVTRKVLTPESAVVTGGVESYPSLERRYTGGTIKLDEVASRQLTAALQLIRIFRAGVEAYDPANGVGSSRPIEPTHFPLPAALFSGPNLLDLQTRKRPHLSMRLLSW